MDPESVDVLYKPRPYSRRQDGRPVRLGPEYRRTLSNRSLRRGETNNRKRHSSFYEPPACPDATFCSVGGFKISYSNHGFFKRADVLPRIIKGMPLQISPHF